MNSPLEKLIKLVQKTGDRLIAYDSRTGSSVVIMDVVDYELLLEDAHGFSADVDNEFMEMSSSEMLDKINRDIAIWRANKKMESDWEDEEDDENDFSFPGEFNFEEKKIDDWYSAGSVIEDRYDLGDSIKKEDSIEFDETLEDDFEKLNEDDLKLEELPFDAPFELDDDTENIEGEWTEESPLDDEPVFLEEPVL